MVQSIIVVGAGIVGSAIAMRLAQAGQKVQVIQGAAPNATNAAFGWINASFFLNEDHHHLRAAGIAAWHRALNEVDAPVQWQGCLCWDMANDQMEATLMQLLDLQYPVELLDRRQLKAREPQVHTLPDRALYFPTEGAASSAEIAHHFLAAAQTFGAKVFSNLHVHRLLKRNEKIVGVATNQGELHADKVIIAAGTGSSALAESIGCVVPLVPRPACILRTNPLPPTLSHILATPDGEIRQEPNGQMLMPVAANHQGDNAETLDVAPNIAATETIKRLRKLLGPANALDWSEIIRAERPVPRDGLPVVGEIAENAYVAVLHSGITLGPVIAELAAKDISGQLNNADAAMLAPYRPHRFAQK